MTTAVSAGNPSQDYFCKRSACIGSLLQTLSWSAIRNEIWWLHVKSAVAPFWLERRRRTLIFRNGRAIWRRLSLTCMQPSNSSSVRGAETRVSLTAGIPPSSREVRKDFAIKVAADAALSQKGDSCGERLIVTTSCRVLIRSTLKRGIV